MRRLRRRGEGGDSGGEASKNPSPGGESCYCTNTMAQHLLTGHEFTSRSLTLEAVDTLEAGRN